jgi:hypothetical protein
MASSKINKKNLQKNRRSIFEVEAAVTTNRAKAYASRSSVEENRAGILKNYTAAFMGNRQLANQNTDDVFRNRKALLSALDASNDVEDNFKESMINQANLDFLEHRSNLNSAVLTVNEKMVIVNKLLIDVNDTIMKANEGIVKFNQNQILQNNKILDNGLAINKATPAKNAERVKQNSSRAKTVRSNAIANSKKMDAMARDTKANRTKIDKNSSLIMARRDSILKNASDISKNQAKVAKKISP